MTLSTEQLFDHARTQNGFLPHAVSEAQLKQLYELLKFGPTASNSQPARFQFVTSPDAKERLLGCLSAGNVDKTRSAPVTVIVGMDLAFPDLLPRLFPHADARSWFVGQPQVIRDAALRNASLQAGYLILAARALGLDCGPMSGFDPAKVDAAFWGGSSVTTNLLVNLGHGDPAKLHPRGPRLAFDEACRIV